MSEERRKRKRVAVHWPIRLFNSLTGTPTESTTENLTSNGFYCVSSEPFALGERVDCIIAIPMGSFGDSHAPISLKCRIRVMRVEDQRDGFGLGCSIEDYDLLVDSRPAHQSMGSP